MDEGTDIPETIQLKTMTPQQERALNQMLRGVMGSIRGLELGTPYGGALESSYSPYTPEYGPMKGADGGGGGDGGDVIRKEQLAAPNGGLTKEQLTAPSDRTGSEGDGKTVIRNGTVVPKDPAPTVGGENPIVGRTVLGEILDIVQRRQTEPTGIPPATGMPPAGDEQTMMMRMLESILSPSAMPVSPTTMPLSPVNVPPAADVLPPEAQPVSAISQLLTQPFVQPFREGMTGNYPGPIRR